jgi:nucleoid-associated protein YgaU
MSSLSVHLKQAEDHSGLPFHPSCPVCRRDRLAGSLDGEELVSRRTQAAITAGLLAFSAVGPPAAVAAGPDEDIEGSAELVETSDPGAIDLGETTIPLPDAGAAPDDAADVSLPEGEDAGREEASVEESFDDAVVEASDEASEPVDEPVPAAEPVVVADPPAEVPTATAPPEQAATDGLRVDSAGTKRVHRVSRVKHATPSIRQRVVPAAAPAAPPAPTLATAITVRVVAGTSTTTTTSKASPGDRFHTVHRGESLWSIASDLLGDGASDARVAREVNRLWELNADRIASGSPDLLFAGTRLRLR